jgi:hypothetical protein
MVGLKPDTTLIGPAKPDTTYETTNGLCPARAAPILAPPLLPS